MLTCGSTVSRSHPWAGLIFPKLQVKRKHVAETFLTRWRSRNRRGDCAERDQLRLRKEPCVYQRLPCGSQLACAARIPLIDQRCKSTDADTPTERADRCAREEVAGLAAGVAGKRSVAIEIGSKDGSRHPIGGRRQEKV